ncbi:MAG: tetratricopeptide repeat protein [Bacteroidales bacterium]|nr:tetratricopeptide repeat protein [Bacteroidales bacterium]
MKKILYLIIILSSFVSCDTRDESFLSAELEEVRTLMQADPQTALLKLQDLKTSEFQNLSDLVTQNLRDIEYSILLAEALYKNYLPQTNFDDLKEIVDYIESGKTTSNSTLRIPNYLCAKAHYYHAVGLGERNDVVGTCEHYLKALEILSEIKTLDNEQTRFLFLTYTRLGELFFNEQYCDIAIVKFRQALKYAHQLNNSNSIANVLKLMGNTYHLAGDIDSALYCFNKSLNIGSKINQLDVEKSIARILFEKGEKDRAYHIVRKNLDKIDNSNSKYSYYAFLGEFYYYDNNYDSAIYYLDHGFKSEYFYTKLYAAMKLSAIYDSLQDYEKKTYYANIISKYSIDNINNSTDNAKIQNVYDKYKERKNEIEASRNRRKVYFIISFLLVFAFIIIMFIRYRYERTHKELVNTLDSKEKAISDYKDKLKRKDQKLAEIRKNVGINIDFEAYHNSEICQKILNRKPTDFTALSEGELALLLESADKNLGNLTKTLNDKYPKLRKDDFYCIYLILLNVEKNKFQYLLGRNRKTIWERLNRIKSIMNIGDNDDLYIFMKNLLR